MKKLLSIIITLVLSLTMIGCIGENVVLSESKTYNVTTQITTLNLELKAGEFNVKNGETFLVESNLKHLSVRENNGVLTVQDNASSTSNFNGAKLTLYIPNNHSFSSVDIDLGAGNLTVEALSSNELDLDFGVGNVTFNSLNIFTSAEIEGGAGNVSILGGTLKNLQLEMGTGELNLTSSLQGNTELSFGVGNSNLTVLGNKNDYTLEITKGVGSIKVDGNSISDSGDIGSGSNIIEITGGVGSITVDFS